MFDCQTSEGRLGRISGWSLSGTALRQCREAWRGRGLLKLERALAGQEDPEQKGNQQKTKIPDNDSGSRASAAAVAIAVAVAVEARRLRIWFLNPADWLQGRT